jgi:hypothetical protein
MSRKFVREDRDNARVVVSMKSRQSEVDRDIGQHMPREGTAALA